LEALDQWGVCWSLTILPSPAKHPKFDIIPVATADLRLLVLTQGRQRMAHRPNDISATPQPIHRTFVVQYNTVEAERTANPLVLIGFEESPAALMRSLSDARSAAALRDRSVPIVRSSEHVRRDAAENDSPPHTHPI